MTMDVTFDTITHIYKYRIYRDSRKKGESFMPLSVLIEMTISAILTVWSPGPNNILLLSTAHTKGSSGVRACGQGGKTEENNRIYIGFMCFVYDDDFCGIG